MLLTNVGLVDPKDKPAMHLPTSTPSMHRPVTRPPSMQVKQATQVPNTDTHMMSFSKSENKVHTCIHHEA
eukprot:12919814-Prorocentrum_lima.AAC.1